MSLLETPFLKYPPSTVIKGPDGGGSNTVNSGNYTLRSPTVFILYHSGARPIEPGVLGVAVFTGVDRSLPASALLGNAELLKSVCDGVPSL